MTKIINSPSKYIQGNGELLRLADYYSMVGESGAYILVDKFVYDNFKHNIEKSFQDNNINYQLQIFGGECTKEEINSNIELLKQNQCDAIIGIGGGKTLDTAKAVSYYANVATLIVPTIASTDAPCSALSVVYTANGEFDEYLFLKSNPNMVIVDTSVVVNAPVRLLVAGIGDALATYYEAKACETSNAKSIAGGNTTKAAMAIAKLCLEILLEDGYKAKLAVENQVCTKAVENIIEANTYLSGVGFESGGLAAAHAIHNGLTILEECHHMYHGEKVAFGTIVQLVLENRELAEIEHIIEFCQSLGLPTNLEDLGLKDVSKERLYEVAKVSTVPDETIHNMPFEVTADDVYAAILTADKLGTLL
ncbi:glycerol dehydrogenase [Psychrobacter sp. FDAARGOS_221]|uniref:glycerol dehydrogenase n=1 Tax=Psychrobacter sp. FDAARGOS_221 TaxID=1975705 RepID=UPI000BB53877|nr:glycerol dehydrogenase [Psychrobacter sp. FDAARGOS_221]PNK59817.1 glycerol dehydrogenase [Psychrobacter sp. FDAARGOS_221]